jgi:hypothetical protein
MVTDASRSYIQPYTTPTNTGSELRITKFGSTVPVLSIDTLNSTIGISTAASSAYTLDVNGTSRFNNLITATGGITATSLHVSGTITYGSESFDVFLANSAGIGVNTITSGYNMEVNGKTRYRDVIAIANGTVSAPGLGFYSEPGTGLYRPNTSQFGFTTSGTEQLRIADKDLYIYPTTSAYIGTTSAYNSNAWTTIESGYQDVTNPTSAFYVSAQGLKLCGQDLIWNSGATRSYGSKIWIGGGQSQFAAVNNSDIILETANAERLRIYGDGNAAFMNNLRVYGNFQVDGTPVGLVKGVTGTSNNISASNTGGNVTLDLVNAGTAGTYTSPSSIVTDTKGRITSIISGSSYVIKIDLNTTGVTAINNLISTNASNYRKCKLLLVGGGGGGGGGKVQYTSFPSSNSASGGGGGSGFRFETIISYANNIQLTSYNLGSGGLAGSTQNYDGGNATAGGNGGITTMTFTYDGNKRYFYTNGGNGGGGAFYVDSGPLLCGGDGGSGFGGGGGGSSDAFFSGTPARNGYGGSSQNSSMNYGMNGEDGNWSPYQEGTGTGGDGGYSSDYWQDNGSTSQWGKAPTNYSTAGGGGPYGGRYLGTTPGNQLLPIRGGGGASGYITFNFSAWSIQPQPGASGHIELTFF